MTFSKDRLKIYVNVFEKKISTLFIVLNYNSICILLINFLKNCLFIILLIKILIFNFYKIIHCPWFLLDFRLQKKKIFLCSLKDIYLSQNDYFTKKNFLSFFLIINNSLKNYTNDKEIFNLKSNVYLLNSKIILYVLFSICH